MTIRLSIISRGPRLSIYVAHNARFTPAKAPLEHREAKCPPSLNAGQRAAPPAALDGFEVR